MAKKVIAAEVERKPIYEKVLENDFGKVLLSIKYPEILTRSKIYMDALKDARDIPFDLQNINPLDPMYSYVLSKFPNYRGRPDQSKQKVQFFYNLLEEDVKRDGMALAIVAEAKDALGESVFAREPKPYEIGDGLTGKEELPGIVHPPEVMKNLDNPSERRLKQFYDFLAEDPKMVFEFERSFEEAIIRINELVGQPEADKDGFQPLPVS